MGKLSFIAAVLLICALEGLAIAVPSQVLVIKSADIVPYNEAVQGFQKNCGCTVSEISLPDMEAGSLLRAVAAREPELILTVGVDALLRSAVIKDLPVVYSMVPTANIPDIVSRRLSGVSMNIPPERYLNAMLELFPSLRRIGVVFDPKNSKHFILEAERIAQKKGVELVLRPVARPSEVLSAVDSLEDRVNLLWMIPDETVVSPETFKYMVGFSFRKSVPLFTFSKKYVDMGAAAGLNAVPREMGGRAGEIARRILAEGGLKSPVRADAIKAELLVNAKIMRKLGMAYDRVVAERADHAN